MDVVNYFDKTFEMMISEEEIKAMVKELAQRVDRDYGESKENPLLVSILDGSFIFMADLVRELTVPFQMEFVKIKSYEGIESSGEIDILLNVKEKIEGKDILIIEDIVDTGLTIEAFVNELKRKNPRSINICTLLSKPEVHNDFLDIKYVGKEIPPSFVIGYGLDINGQGRNLRSIYQLVT